MAILKSISTDYGVDATYWNIFSINESFKEKTLEVVIMGYFSKTVREAGASPVAWQNLQLTGDAYIQDANRPAIYKILKLKPEFADSIDDL